ncbi:Oidioi.mRNA.OKI2018_I69.chr1.g1373.t1.cds [Oikopleura dioica]|uniref:Oidioi.mRNA.OKI2018_I69.chr1.g1373.t1.cds n=1 Tax=Oikopleura dioica TaxID=34765 RepID=A0ABN7SRH7_OIKDI|nr:Oidioi.mRNA.OKI2018_I69.chr1.g1373.t1.cds [Oikopleura dioica]
MTGSDLENKQSEEKATQIKAFICMVFCSLLMGVTVISIADFANSFWDDQFICNAPDPYVLEDGVTLVLRAPAYPTCQECSQQHVPGSSSSSSSSQSSPGGNFESECGPGCYVYHDDRNCPLTIKSETEQITYRLKFLDVDPLNDCGDYLSIIGREENLCGYYSSKLEIDTIANEIQVLWNSDSIPNDDHEGFELWIWSRDPNERSSGPAFEKIQPSKLAEDRLSEEERADLKTEAEKRFEKIVRY